MEYSNRFIKLLKLVLQREGGYSNISSDKGGATNKGITQAVYDTFRHKKLLSLQTVKLLTLDETSEIYYREYYSPLGLDAVQQESASDILFDLAVNSGLHRAKDFIKSYGENPQILLQARYNFYHKICSKQPSQSKFLKGWISRLNQIASRYGLRLV